MTEIERAKASVIALAQMAVSCIENNDPRTARDCLTTALESVQFLIQQEGE